MGKVSLRAHNSSLRIAISDRSRDLRPRDWSHLGAIFLAEPFSWPPSYTVNIYRYKTIEADENTSDLTTKLTTTSKSYSLYQEFL